MSVPSIENKPIQPKKTGAEMPSGLRLLAQLSGHKDSISRIAWSANGRFLASASRDKTVGVWDTSKIDQQINPSLKHNLIGHTGWVIDVAWSPDGRKLVSCSDDKSARVWDADSGKQLLLLEEHQSTVKAVAWSPDGRYIATGSEDKMIFIWNAATGVKEMRLAGHTGGVFSLAWSPDGKQLLSGSDDSTVRIWVLGKESGSLRRVLQGHTQAVYGVIWSPEGEMIASCSNDKTARIWDAKTGREISVLEGHTNGINCLSYSHHGRLLVSKADNVRIWRTDIWDELVTIPEPDAGVWPPGVAFHPTRSILASLGNQENDILRLWELDVAILLGNAPHSKSVQYTNAKVVLLGDTGVGKSALGLGLMGEPFTATESTHGRHIWTLDVASAETAKGRHETRETLIWDMAGQPGYRLVHQLYLSEVTVALVLIDSRSETDPFAGARHWARALAQAEKTQGASIPPIKKILVAARCDRGGIAASKATINKFMEEMGFEAYIETSAKEGRGIEELLRLVKSSIDWDKLPKVSSPRLFQLIKDFLLREKEKGIVLAGIDNLYQAFVQASYGSRTPPKTLRSNFEACLARVQSRGLIQLLSFGDLVLLQPELLDAYASALVNAARDEPNGVGCLSLQDARDGKFAMPSELRLKKKNVEQLLLAATVENLLGHEIALRVHSEDETLLVFPSQFTREHPDMPDPEGKALIYYFKGAVLNVYTTLVVRLSHSLLFGLKEMWKNAVIYSANVHGTYGIYLEEKGEGEARLVLFFGEDAPEATRFHFEEFVEEHIKRNAIPESMKRERVFACPKCGTQVNPNAVARRREMKFDYIKCNVCEDVQISILDGQKRVRERATQTIEVISEMDRNADKARDDNKTEELMIVKNELGDFDVFLSYNSKDRDEVRQIYKQLQAKGVLPWFDEDQLQPGRSFQRELEKHIPRAKAAAVFIGANSLGPWQSEEQQAVLLAFNRRDEGVIPVILKSCENKEPQLPLFLQARTWVDFRQENPDPLERLIWGIRGKKDKDVGGPQK